MTTLPFFNMQYYYIVHWFSLFLNQYSVILERYSCYFQKPKCLRRRILIALWCSWLFVDDVDVLNYAGFIAIFVIIVVIIVVVVAVFVVIVAQSQLNHHQIDIRSGLVQSLWFYMNRNSDPNHRMCPFPGQQEDIRGKFYFFYFLHFQCSSLVHCIFVAVVSGRIGKRI